MGLKAVLYLCFASSPRLLPPSGTISYARHLVRVKELFGSSPPSRQRPRTATGPVVANIGQLTEVLADNIREDACIQRTLGLKEPADLQTRPFKRFACSKVWLWPGAR